MWAGTKRQTSPVKRLPARRSGQGVRPELVTAHGRLSSGQVSSFGGSERGDRESIFLPDIYRQPPPPPHRWYSSVFWHELWSPQTGSLCNVRPAMNNLLITLIQQRGSRTPSDPPFISKALWWMVSMARLSNQRLKSPLLPFPLP